MGDLYLRMIWKTVEPRTVVVYAKKYFTNTSDIVQKVTLLDVLQMLMQMQVEDTAALCTPG